MISNNENFWFLSELSSVSREVCHRSKSKQILVSTNDLFWLVQLTWAKLSKFDLKDITNDEDNTFMSTNWIKIHYYQLKQFIFKMFFLRHLDSGSDHCWGSSSFVQGSGQAYIPLLLIVKIKILFLNQISFKIIAQWNFWVALFKSHSKQNY